MYNNLIQIIIVFKPWGLPWGLALPPMSALAVSVSPAVSIGGWNVKFRLCWYDMLF